MTTGVVLPNSVNSSGIDAIFTSNGILTRTAASTYTSRTLTGTTNQIVVTNGDGVSGNPTFATPQDIGAASSPTFAGLTMTGTLKQSLVYSTPTTGQTVVAAATTQVLVIEPAGLLLALTVTFPSTPATGQTFRLMFGANGVTGLTVGAGAATIRGTITTGTADTSSGWIYRSTNTTWYRL